MNKKYFLLLLLLPFIGIISSYGQYTSIPDADFEATLGNLGYDDISGDKQVPTANIASVTSLNLSFDGIDDLTGIEDFVALESLRAHRNDLVTVDLSKNTALKTLNIGNNDLTSLDVSSNVNLESLDIDDLNLTSGIDLSNNTKLTLLSAENANLSSIDLSNNTLLERIDLEENPVTTLDVSIFPNLNNLNVSKTQLSSIDLSHNTLLRSFYFDDCDFTSLDFSGLANLEIIDAQNNDLLTSINLTGVTALTTFQIKNAIVLETIDFSDAINLNFIALDGSQLGDLDLSNNTMITNISLIDCNLTSLDLRNMDITENTFFNISENPELTCVSVSDPTYARNNFTDDVEYSIGCNDYTYVPDDNFEAILGILDDIPNDNFIPNTSIQILTGLDISSENISDLTGINGFSSLTTLDASDNNLKLVDFSDNLLLESINLENNALIALDASSLTNLTSLDVSDNALQLLNIQNGSNTTLTAFDATNNANLTCVLVDDETNAPAQFTNVDSQTSFSETDCTYYISIPDANFETALAAYDDVSGDNQIPFGNIYTLTELSVNGASISNISGIESFVSLVELNCNSNSFTAIDLSNNVKLEVLKIERNELLSLDLSNNTLLNSIACDTNDFTSLDFSNNPNLISITAEDNANLATINLTGCSILEELIVENSNISTLDITSCVNLTKLDVDENNLSSIDLGQNTLLEQIYLDSNNITSLDISNNTLLENFSMKLNPIVTLDFTYNTALVSITMNDNEFLTAVAFGLSPSLNFINASDTALETIDTSSLEDLDTFYLERTNITSLDLSANTGLFDLQINDNVLEKLNLENLSGFFNIDITNNPNLYCIQVSDASNAESSYRDDVDAQVAFKEDCESCRVDATVFLEGPFDEVTTTMNDDLRTNDLLPTTSPYEDAITCDASVFTTTGEQAVIDWVEVQLRDTDDNTEVEYRKSALLLANGTIKDTDGTSDLTITAWEGDYYIAIAHRNHLTIASNVTYTLNGTTTAVDFTSTGNVEGGTSALVDLNNGNFGIPLGDIDENGQVQNTDSNTVITQIGISGYSVNDLDLNGQVQNTDVNALLQNIGKGEQF